MPAKKSPDGIEMCRDDPCHHPVVWRDLEGRIHQEAAPALAIADRLLSKYETLALLWLCPLLLSASLAKATAAMTNEVMTTNAMRRFMCASSWRVFVPTPGRPTIGPMGDYRVLLHGHNLWLELDGKVRQIGFYVTRFVEITDERSQEWISPDETPGEAVFFRPDGVRIDFLDMHEIDSLIRCLVVRIDCLALLLSYPFRINLVIAAPVGLLSTKTSLTLAIMNLYRMAVSGA